MWMTTDQVVSFLEKPADPPPIPGKPDKALASMGIYVFNAEVPVRPVAPRRRRPDLQPRFRQGPDPYLVPRAKVMAHRFQDSCIYSQPDAEPYWRDVGTIDAYWEANLDLTTVTPI